MDQATSQELKEGKRDEYSLNLKDKGRGESNLTTIFAFWLFEEFKWWKKQLNRQIKKKTRRNVYCFEWNISMILWKSQEEKEEGLYPIQGIKNLSPKKKRSNCIYTYIHKRKGRAGKKTKQKDNGR